MKYIFAFILSFVAFNSAIADVSDNEIPGTSLSVNPCAVLMVLTESRYPDGTVDIRADSKPTPDQRHFVVTYIKQADNTPLKVEYEVMSKSIGAQKAAEIAKFRNAATCS